MNTRVHICLVHSLIWLLSLHHTANKAVETDEMWKLRRAEIEFDERLKRKSREESSSVQSEQNNRRSFVKRCTSVDENVARSSPSSSQSRNKRLQPDEYDDDGKGLGDVEVETFLQSRYVLYTLILDRGCCLVITSFLLIKTCDYGL